MKRRTLIVSTALAAKLLHVGSGWESILGLQFENLVVYEGELAPVVRGNGYFDAIISAADLLGA